MKKSDSSLRLQEAMVLVLLERKHAAGMATLDTTALAYGIAKRKLYTRGDGQQPKAAQVGARAKRYPGLFAIELQDGRRVVSLRRLPRL